MKPARRALLLSLAAWPVVVRAQPTRRRHRIAYLSGGAIAARREWIEGLFDGLAAFGYHRDRDLDVMMRGASGQFSNLPALAAELVAWAPDVMVVSTTPGVHGDRCGNWHRVVTLLAQPARPV